MVSAKQVNDILAHFERTSDQFFSKEEFKAKLRGPKKLRIKYGVDVTAPTLHIGHAVNLWLMRFLQDRGHKVVFLIGDFTTRIGDPTGKSDTRPVIPREEIENNARLFISQAQMVLRFDDPNLLEIRRNSEWYDKMAMQDFMNLLAQVTHARLISRDMFQQRIEGGRDIHMHEMLYPVLQGYDSVMVEADATVIGSDQLFNEMMGRTLQEKAGQKPQTIITTKITPGIDGRAKQSKSLGNYIGLAHSPRDKFGRVMSIPDNLIEEYFHIYTDLPAMELAALKGAIEKKPRDAKAKLAYHIVERYHGPKVAEWEREWFDNTISKGNMPDDIPTLAVIDPQITALDLVALVRVGKSKGDTRRLITQGGVELNGDKLHKPDEMLTVSTNDILKVGKRNWYRIEVTGNKLLTTEHLRMDPLQLQDISLLTAYLPAWEIVKYLTKPLSAWIGGDKGKIELKSIAPAGPASKASSVVASEVFKKIMSKPEPKDEWLWKISKHEAPDEMIGIAHLRRDFEHGNQNVWLVPEHQDAGLAHEAMVALNEHAFTNLGFNTMIFKEAFAHVAKDEAPLSSRFLGLEPAIRPMDSIGAAFGVTKAAWQQTHPPAAAAAPPAVAMDPMLEEEILRSQNPYHLMLPESTAPRPQAPVTTPVAPPVLPVVPPAGAPLATVATPPATATAPVVPPLMTPVVPVTPTVTPPSTALPFSPAAAVQPKMTPEEEEEEIRRSAPPTTPKGPGPSSGT